MKWTSGLGLLTISGLGACGSPDPHDPKDTGGDDTGPVDGAPDEVVYVTASGTGDGTSWADATSSLQKALAQVAGAGNAWILVGEGTYTPTPGEDRTASFVLLPGVSVYGGFAGTESGPEDRDWAAHPTILSGEIGSGAVTDNSYHVVTGSDGAVLDGVIVEKGYAFPEGVFVGDGDVSDLVDAIDPGAEILRILDGVEVVAGAGMYNIHAAPTVRNTTFRDNQAGKGAAVYNMVTREFPLETRPYPAARFENVIFENNWARNRGGAIDDDLFTSPTFIDVEFRGNSCDEKGGAVYDDMGSSPRFVNVLFAGNWSGRGGAMANDGTSSPVLVYATLVDNEANDLGAGLYQGTYSPNGSFAGFSSANEVSLAHVIEIANATLYTTSSDSNWHDSIVTADDSTIETSAGELDPTDYFYNYATGDYRTAPSYGYQGWDPDREIDDPDALLGVHHQRDYPGYPYATDSDSPVDDYPPIYVDAAAVGSADGTSWADAYPDLQDALEVVEETQAVFVHGGTYRPTDETTRETSFVLREGVLVYGGFCGTESDPADRVKGTCPTVLSGDIGTAGEPSDNSYHVVVGAAEALLDGFDVTGGNANGEWYHARGGGLLAYHQARVVVRDVTFYGNTALEGGAFVAYDSSHAILEDCVFVNNSARSGGAALFRYGSDVVVSGARFESNVATMRAGAVLVDYGSNTQFSATTFEGNAATGNGGAIYVDDDESQFGSTTLSFDACAFTSNTSGARGGAIAAYNTATTVTIHDTSFDLNSATSGGGAVAVDFYATLSLDGCTFSGNAGGAGQDDVDAESTAVVHEK